MQGDGSVPDYKETLTIDRTHHGIGNIKISSLTDEVKLATAEITNLSVNTNSNNNKVFY
jgi:hypothetical protein